MRRTRPASSNPVAQGARRRDGCAGPGAGRPGGGCARRRTRTPVRRGQQRQLRATENFQQLQAELATENQIAGARARLRRQRAGSDSASDVPGNLSPESSSFAEAPVLRIEDAGDRAVPGVVRRRMRTLLTAAPAAPSAPASPPPAPPAPDPGRRRAESSATSPPTGDELGGDALRGTSRRCSRSAARNCRAQPGLPQLTTPAPLGGSPRHDCSRVPSKSLVAWNA